MRGSLFDPGKGSGFQDQGTEAHADGSFFHARLRVRLLGLKKSSKKSVFGENRLAVRVFEGKKSSIESSIGTRLQENVFRARKNSPPSKSNFESNISGQKTWTKCWNSSKSNFKSNISGKKTWTKCWNSAKSNFVSNISSAKTWTKCWTSENQLHAQHFSQKSRALSRALKTTRLSNQQYTLSWDHRLQTADPA